MDHLKPNIVVVGSLNIDWTARVRQLPLPGETIPASSMNRSFGGKGANQAIAAARQGARVSLIGCVGDDDAGRSYRDHLEAEGIDASAVATAPLAMTGMAMIAVDDAAENSIIVNEGANGHLSAAHILANRHLLEEADAILIQWEIPDESILKVLELAGAGNVPVVMNPSPPRAGLKWDAYPVHTLILNESEALFFMAKRSERTPEAMCIDVRAHNLTRIIVTRGSKPTWGITDDAGFEQPAFPVIPQDTVGAGDSFAGAYTVALARGLPFQDAIRHANVSGALATTKSGAQASIPTLAAVEEAMNSTF